MKIRPVGAELFHADRRTDGQTWRSYEIVFRNFADTPKNVFKSSPLSCSTVSNDAPVQLQLPTEVVIRGFLQIIEFRL
jgi:hypothetical protein